MNLRLNAQVMRYPVLSSHLGLFLLKRFFHLFFVQWANTTPIIMCIMPSYVPSTCDDNFFIIQAATVSDIVMLISPTFLTSSFSANFLQPSKYKSKTEKLLINFCTKSTSYDVGEIDTFSKMGLSF